MDFLNLFKDEILNYLKGDSEIPIIVINSEGEIFYANNAFYSLVSNRLEVKAAHYINEIFTVVMEETANSKEITLIRTDKHNSIKITGKTIQKENNILVIFEDYVFNDDSITEKLTTMNIEMSNITRELAKKNAKLEQANKKITELLNKDYLTQVGNRKYFYERLEEMISYYKRTKNGKLALVLCDIDNFKNVNDTYGHDVGDLVLVNFAGTLKDKLRKEDVVARFGGEEFIVILTCSDEEDVKEVAERLRKLVSKITITGHDLTVTASFGATEYHFEDTVDSIIKRADEAMYEAKDKGRNNVVYKSRLDGTKNN
jgi:diguanylate cyclase (GGDEF)-like protein